MNTRSKHDRTKQLVKAIKHRLKQGEAFYLGCTNQDFYINMLPKHLDNIAFEKWEDGLVIRRSKDFNPALIASKRWNKKPITLSKISPFVEE